MLNINQNQQQKYKTLSTFLLSPKFAADKVTGLFISCTLFLLAFLALLLLVNAFDSRLIDGMPVWHKPIRFGLSFVLHFITLTYLAQLVDEKYRTKYRFSFFAVAAAISLWLEFLYITIQAARGRRSHFNFETDIENYLYMAMGVGALFLVLVAFVLGIMIWKYGKKDQSGLRLGSIAGLTIGSVLTLVFAGYMSVDIPYITNRLNHTPNVVPYLGWSRISGDYKPAHFIATHMMQLLPLIGIWADRSKLKSYISPRKIVMLGIIILTLLSIFAFILAKLDIPIFPV
ncbi:hypothetical protein [Kangiella sp. HZ709]|uniref:hypothetical protein n=1 Tax=Kangiella sp. HZ709 TaxID=2666328 RepID=UPI0012B0B143|nr:hypothetical protein [Kangiella sp. HZ709]MRX27444.1 hypothetical protein [Kangiella sp. HZ709]